MKYHLYSSSPSKNIINWLLVSSSVIKVRIKVLCHNGEDSGAIPEFKIETFLKFAFRLDSIFAIFTIFYHILFISSQNSLVLFTVFQLLSFCIFFFVICWSRRKNVRKIFGKCLTKRKYCNMHILYSLAVFLWNFFYFKFFAYQIKISKNMKY